MLNVLLVKTWVPMESTYYSISGVSWYLCDILIFYAAFPFILKRLKKLKGKRKAFCHSVVIYAIMVAVGYVSSLVRIPETVSNNFTKWITYVFPVYRLGDFIIGCELGYIYSKGRSESVSVNKSKKTKNLITLEEIGLVVLICGGALLRINKVLF